MGKKLGAEFLGTFWLVLGGCGSAVLAAGVKVVPQGWNYTVERFGRYLDVDGDGIGFRTYPGTHPEKGAFFTRGTSRDEYAAYTESGPWLRVGRWLVERMRARPRLARLVPSNAGRKVSNS